MTPARCCALLLLTLLPAAQAQTTVLRPLPLSAACAAQGYSAQQDRAGTLRVLRYLRTVPDDARRVTQYYGSDGRLQSVRASAVGFKGTLYDLTARAATSGQLGTPQGYRSKLYTEPVELSGMLLNASAVRAGRCS